MKKIILLILIVFSCAPVCHAGEDGFAANADDILRMITDPGGRAFLQIEFNVNSAAISEKAYPLVDALGTALTSGPGASMQVKLVGHTDSFGNSDYNRQLSLKRAVAVKNYLIKQFSIDPARLEVEGMGEDQAIAPNDNAAGRAKNRRVEVINISKPPAADKGIQELQTKDLW